MSARVIVLFLVSLLIGSAWTLPAQAFSTDGPHRERIADACASCFQLLGPHGGVDGDTVGDPSAQAEVEAGTEQPEMLCLFEANEPPFKASKLTPSLEARAPVGPFLDGPDRPPNASARHL
jgi:hypothetical protein